MTDVLLIALAVFSCLRITQLVVVDEGPYGVFLAIRKRAGVNASDGGKVWNNIAELLHCPYCMGIWVAFFLALMLGPSNLFEFILLWFGIAGGQAILEEMRNGTE